MHRMGPQGVLVHHLGVVGGHPPVWREWHQLPKRGNKWQQSAGVHIPNSTGHAKSVGARIPNSKGRTEVWESVTPTQGATPKRGSPSPQLKGPHRSVGVWKCKEKERKNALWNHRCSPPESGGRAPNAGSSLRNHTEAWESITPTQGATPKCGSQSPNSSAECSGSGACGQLGALGTHRLLRPVPLTTNCWPEAPLGGGGGGVGVLGPAELHPRGNTQADDTLPSMGARGGANCRITPRPHTQPEVPPGQKPLPHPHPMAPPGNPPPSLPPPSPRGPPPNG